MKSIPQTVFHHPKTGDIGIFLTESVRARWPGQEPQAIIDRLFDQPKLHTALTALVYLHRKSLVGLPQHLELNANHVALSPQYTHAGWPDFLSRLGLNIDFLLHPSQQFSKELWHFIYGHEAGHAESRYDLEKRLYRDTLLEMLENWWPFIEPGQLRMNPAQWSEPLDAFLESLRHGQWRKAHRQLQGSVSYLALWRVGRELQQYEKICRYDEFVCDRLGVSQCDDPAQAIAFFQSVQSLFSTIRQDVLASDAAVEQQFALNDYLHLHPPHEQRIAQIRELMDLRERRALTPEALSNVETSAIREARRGIRMLRHHR